jgi:hypothetical protein
MDCPVAVLPHARVRGVETLNDAGVELLPVTSLVDALSATHETDSHFVPYCVVGPDGVESSIPRCNKPVLSEIRKSGGDIRYTAFVFDWDTPNHEPIDADSLADAMAKVEDLPDDLWAGLTAFYTTRSGFRLVFRVDEPVPVTVGEGVHRAIMEILRSHGIDVDEACSDWTRLYRLPKVLRDDERTEDAPHFTMILRPDASLPASSLPAPSKVTTRSATAAPRMDAEMPDPDDMTLLKQGRKQTEWYRAAKKSLQGQDYYGKLIDGEALSEEGERDQTLTKTVGHAVGHLVALVPGTTAEHIFALFVPSVQQWRPDTGTPDWAHKLWSLICRFYPREVEKARQQAEEDMKRKAVEDQVVLETSNNIVDGMREWCDDPALAQPEPEEFILRNIFVRHDNGFYMLRPNGRYSDRHIPRDMLISAIRNDEQMNLLVPTRKMQNREMVDRSIQNIVNDHTSDAVDEVIYRPSRMPLGVIEDRKLVFPIHQLNPNIEARYDAEVDEWLRAFFGESNYERGIEWIAWALDLPAGPICALSIMGPPSIGKKMLVNGIAENFINTEVADGTALVSRYRGALLRTALLNINEGLPSDIGFGAEHPSDVVRRLVAGDSMLVEEKYRPSVMLQVPMRLIFTTNNLDPLKMLSAQKNLSPDDREALSIRLLHMKAGHEAATYLQRKGGMEFTGREGRRWIRGDGGAKSDFIVAMHFRHLFERRHEFGPRGKRLLVEGNADGALLDEIQTQGGAYPLVIETIVAMLNDQQKPKGMVIEDGEIKVFAQPVLEYFRRNIASPSISGRLTRTDVSDALRGLSLHGESQKETRRSSDYRNKHYWSLDIERLYRRITQDGMSCKALERMIDE